MTRFKTMLAAGALLAAPAQAQNADKASVLDRLDALEAVLNGAIIASPDPCPKLGAEWVPYMAAEGRFLLGAGDGYEAGKDGGEPEVTLTEAQMPEHHHKVRLGNNTSKGPDTWGVQHSDAHGGDWGTRGTTQAGQNEPHENMPPYRVIHFCKLGG